MTVNKEKVRIFNLKKHLNCGESVCVCVCVCVCVFFTSFLYTPASARGRRRKEKEGGILRHRKGGHERNRQLEQGRYSVR